MISEAKIDKLLDRLTFDKGLLFIEVDSFFISEFPNCKTQVIPSIDRFFKKKQSDGDVEEFEIMDTAILKNWNRFSQIDHFGPTKFLVGVGGRHLTGVQVDLSEEKEKVCLVSMKTSSEEMGKVHPKWLENHINRRLKTKGQSWVIESGFVQVVWERLVNHHENISNYPLYGKLDRIVTQHKNSFVVKIVEKSQDIVIVLFNIKSFSAETLTSAILESITKAIDKLAYTEYCSCIFKVLHTHIRQNISDAFSGPARYGLDLPISFLGAIGINVLDKLSARNRIIPYAFFKSLKENRKNIKEAVLGDGLLERDLSETINNGILTGILVKDNKKLSLSGDILLKGFISDKIDRECIKQSLEMAKTALYHTKSNERDYQSLLIGVSSENIETFKDKIKHLKIRLADEVELSRGPELSLLNLQVVPISTSYSSNESITKNQNLANKNCTNLIIREMIDLQDAGTDASWFKQRLIPEISAEDIKKSIAALRRGNFITYDANSGKYRLTNRDIIAETPEFSKSAGFHQNMIDISLEALNWKSSFRPEMASISLLSTPDSRKAISEIYKDALIDLMDFASAATRRDFVCFLGIQLFPITKATL